MPEHQSDSVPDDEQRPSRSLLIRLCWRHYAESRLAARYRSNLASRRLPLQSPDIPLFVLMQEILFLFRVLAIL